MTLHWIFSNGHKWHKQFEAAEAAEAYAHACGLITGPHVDRVWIDTGAADIWLREKT